MRKVASAIILCVVSMVSSAYGFQSVDYNCMNDCTDNGYMYQYCQSRCSYDNAPQAPSSVDYTCMSDCENKGYMYSYCQQACSY